VEGVEARSPPAGHQVTALAPACSYMGGKSRVARRVANLILARRPGTVHDLCCGSGAVSLEVVARGFDPRRLVMVEAGPWADYWAAVADGTLNLDLLRDLLGARWPGTVAAAVSYLQDEVTAMARTPEVFLVLQAFAWSGFPAWYDEAAGRWRVRSQFYKCRDRRSNLNGPRRARVLEAVGQHVRRMKGARVVRVDVADLGAWLDPEDPDPVYYLDPPYEGTEGYGWSLDVDEFVSRAPRPLLVSEQRPVPGADLVGRVGARRAGSIRPGTKGVHELVNVFE